MLYKALGPSPKQKQGVPPLNRLGFESRGGHGYRCLKKRWKGEEAEEEDEEEEGEEEEEEEE